ncbi:hypothetical protein WR25_00466 [Diploscapter pachys]|uniref:VWFA domain-containing protein n=1 Tax=Diploscapter pachys TaxID=2018661 RepID=A0A2A2K3Y1_9BILA|nr:hypothetical protein WR25_00466 [Diploscapter pachys]
MSLLFIGISFLVGVQLDRANAACGVADGFQYQQLSDVNPYAAFWPPVDDMFMACAGNYTAYVYSGDPERGLTGLMMKGFKPIPGQQASLTIYNSDGTIFGIITDDATGNALNSKIATPNITVIWQQTGTQSYGFTGQMQRADQPPGPTTVITTMPPPTTRAYNGSGIDPWLISHDLLIAIDSGKKPDQNTWEKLKILITKFDKLLKFDDATVDNATTYDTRQTLISLTPFNSNPFTPVWQTDYNVLSDYIPQMRPDPSNKAVFVSSLLSTADIIFKIITDPTDPKFIYSTRPNAQRTVVLFTSSTSSDFEDFVKTGEDTLAQKFLDLDIRLLVVGFGMDQDSLAKYSQETNWFSFFNALDNTMDVVNQLAQDYFVVADKLCPPVQAMLDQALDNTQTELKTPISEPLNYLGPKDDKTKTFDTDGGQTGRYCNFQKNNYVIRNNVKTAEDPPQQGAICMTIYYQLEVDKDFVHVYKGVGQDKKAVASFSGLEVLGSRMEIYDSVTITFTSDNEEVYGGFYIQATSGECPASSTLKKPIIIH